MILLCIDDDQDDLDLLCEAVKVVKPAYKFVSARNGAKGLEFLESIVPDYIFLDINMPGMSGWELIRLIRSKRKFDAVPVFMLSTTTNKAEAEQYTRMGATSCLVKPCSFHELCEMIKNLLNEK